MKQLAKYLDQGNFVQKLSIRHTNTHRTDCSPWTTKVAKYHPIVRMWIAVLCDLCFVAYLCGVKMMDNRGTGTELTVQRCHLSGYSYDRSDVFCLPCHDLFIPPPTRSVNVGILFFQQKFLFFFRRRMFDVARPIGNLYNSEGRI